MIDPARVTVLITGAAGRIGTALRHGLRSGGRHLLLTDVCPVEDLADNEECVVADVSDRAAYEKMMEGVSAIVHMAGAGANYSLEHLLRIRRGRPVGVVRARGPPCPRSGAACAMRAFSVEDLSGRVRRRPR